ncbi:hypothetical protein WICMUC_003667 [Wickerhamomyces mucosus]|uniref:Uncharacterized protein n=1 Tax=Wickerhamomyces mucosus TaxID=1378264 RepID=A0A9P8PL73_9ASCO|nr:hypothetical protein WICMUC_003667 [Wickerhamomyces mucosus]
MLLLKRKTQLNGTLLQNPTNPKREVIILDSDISDDEIEENNLHKQNNFIIKSGFNDHKTKEQLIENEQEEEIEEEEEEDELPKDYNKRPKYYYSSDSEQDDNLDDVGYESDQEYPIKDLRLQELQRINSSYKRIRQNQIFKHDLEVKKVESKKKINSIWQSIINKYSAYDENNQGDIVNLNDFSIEENKGHIEKLQKFDMTDIWDGLDLNNEKKSGKRSQKFEIIDGYEDSNYDPINLITPSKKRKFYQKLLKTSKLKNSKFENFGLLTPIRSKTPSSSNISEYNSTSRCGSRSSSITSYDNEENYNDCDYDDHFYEKEEENEKEFQNYIDEDYFHKYPPQEKSPGKLQSEFEDEEPTVDLMNLITPRKKTPVEYHELNYLTSPKSMEKLSLFGKDPINILTPTKSHRIR